MTDRPHPNDARFWDLAEEFLARPGVTKSTMMGFACLRVDGKFFACCDRETGDLVVKLPESRVESLIAAERGQPFAPAGRRFREGVRIPQHRSRMWRRLLTRRAPS